LKDEIDTIYWNKEGFKYGICNTPPIGQVKILISI
jgi:tubulin epsilon